MTRPCSKSSTAAGQQPNDRKPTSDGPTSLGRARAPRGRPPSGSLLTVDDAGQAVIDRLGRELPVACADVAGDLGTNRRTLAEVVLRDTGLAWGTWIYRISRTWNVLDLEDVDVRRFVVTLDDQTADRLRRRALTELRDPRMVARLILERALPDRPSEPVGPLRELVG